MEQKRIKVRLTENSPYSEYGYYKRGDIGYIDGYVSGCAVIILENGKFAKAELRWIEVVNAEDKNTNTEPKVSEDERIRAKLTEFFAGYSTDEEWWGSITEKDILAWLEKQGEQIDYNEELKKCKENPLYFYDKYCKIKIEGQKPAWSEDDEKKRKCLIKGLEDRMGFGWASDPFSREELINWLKSLKDRYAWKPSSEQMEALEYFIVYHNDSTNYVKDLEELRLQLKKLREK